MSAHPANKKIKIEYENENENASSSNPHRGRTIPSTLSHAYEDTKEDIKSQAYEDTKEDIKPYAYEDTKEDIKPHIGNSSVVAESERVKRIQEYKRILTNYQPLHRELSEMNFTSFLEPSFVKAINDSTENGVRKVVSEPAPGIITFNMFRPEFCRMLIEEYKNFKNWARETRTTTMRPNTMYEYGAVLDDLGMETVLGKLMKDYILPMSTIFFPEVGGAILDSHHGFIVEYGTDGDHHLDFHVDDSEVTVNVCLGEQFSGGELFFRGVRCVKHVDVRSELEENFDYLQVPGLAVMHRGRHRHGARPNTSGHRVNMLLWCRSNQSETSITRAANWRLLTAANDNFC